MTPSEFKAANDDMNTQLEGDGYYLNIYMKSGVQLLDYRFSYTRSDMICAEKDDHPPAYLPIDHIEFITLSNGTDPYVP